MSNYSHPSSFYTPTAHMAVDTSYLQRATSGPPPISMPQFQTSSFPSEIQHPPPMMSPHPPSPLTYPAPSMMPEADNTVGFHTRTSTTYTFAPMLDADKAKLTRRMPLPNDYILDSQIIDDTKAVRFIVKSDRRGRETKVQLPGAAWNETPVATFDFDHTFSSQMTIGDEAKVKCKDWVPYWPKDRSRRIFKHEDMIYVWIIRGDVNTLEPENRPGFSIVICSRNSYRELKMEVFQEAFAVPKLVEVIITAVVLLESRSDSGLGESSLFF